MSDEILVCCCAPTLAGIKTGSLFNCPCPNRQALIRQIRATNRVLQCRGLILLPLRYSERNALLYLFRPLSLQRDLRVDGAQSILDGAGYRGLPLGQCLVRLRQRLAACDDFPHEIGLFLSYPPEDVRGFIENHAQNYKFTGCWKVYGDEAAARRTFEKYDRCTASYCRRLRAGCTLEQLAVAV